MSPTKNVGYWRFVAGPSDEFSTSLNADVWSRSFPSWPGTPPAAIVEDSAAVNASDGTLEITARLDPDFTCVFRSVICFFGTLRS